MRSDSVNASAEIVLLSFREMTEIYDDEPQLLEWKCLFTLPFWLEAWWEAFGGDKKLMILCARSGGETLGIAPLMAEGKTARFIGSENVCDYQDMIVAPGRDESFYKGLLDYLANSGFLSLELGPVRADASVFSVLPEIAGSGGYTVTRKHAGASCELTLPETWEAYLKMLSGKQRHEIRRKMRRLYEAGHVEAAVVRDPETVVQKTEGFLDLFQMSRQDKAQFLTAEMKAFFKSVFEKMAKRNLLALYVLKINQAAAAMTVCFDYGDALNLYNNGYEPKFKHLSAGVMSKIMSIRDAIARDKRRFDFLQGDEAYKKRLGGREKPLYRFVVELRE